MVKNQAGQTIMMKLFRQIKEDLEYCFHIETSAPLTVPELEILKWLLRETFEPRNLDSSSFWKETAVVEFGPRLNFATPFSTNAVAACHSAGLTKVIRMECSRRHLVPTETDMASFVACHHDRMTECVYETPLTTFAIDAQPKPTLLIPLSKRGMDEMIQTNREMGLGMDDWDMDYFYELFVDHLQRDPTDVELFQVAQGLSEHCRHPFFKGRIIIDGELMPRSLMEVIKDTLRVNPADSVLAFCDNSSSIRGRKVWTIIPAKPGRCSPFGRQIFDYDLVFTAETHNHPSMIAPFPGAETGTGGRIRDNQATGRGSLVIAGTVGFCVGSLNLDDFTIPGEMRFDYPDRVAKPLAILIGESNGAFDYGNKFGEPVIAGYTRTFGQVLPDGERREWIKPIMFTGGLGQMDHRHRQKGKPQKGMLAVMIGGPAYRIGVGGGAASSMTGGANTAQLDFQSVQRGDAETENRYNRVIRACVEMGRNNPIVTIHDQGAGGPSNVLTELVDPAGGRINIRRIVSGDPTLSVLELWSAEFQERVGLLIWPNRLAEFKAFCRRERVNCEVLGEVTDDGQIVVIDTNPKTDCRVPVSLPLKEILGQIPPKTFETMRQPKSLQSLVIHPTLTIGQALEMVFRLPSVGSKNWAVRKVDRSVTGLVCRQQCCGPLQLPVADVAVVAQSHFSERGGATAIGEQPIKMLVNAKAGARMAVAEMMTNMVWALISRRSDIKCSVNWMWPAKMPGEGAELYDAAVALSDLMIRLGTAADGGKDSLSMAVKVGDKMVKAPGQVVVSGYAPVPDVTKVITPDLKSADNGDDTFLFYLDLARGKKRLGGSALAQALNQIGDESPDVEDPELLIRAFDAVQEMIRQNLILSGHDISDGGLITTLVEMAISGNCGIHVNIGNQPNPLAFLFAEEAGLVLEVRQTCLPSVVKIMSDFDLFGQFIGYSNASSMLTIAHGTKNIFTENLRLLRLWWEATSDRLEQEQTSPAVKIQHISENPHYRLRFTPIATPRRWLTGRKPKVAVIREEGSNGDREMASAFFAAGFEPWDVTMTDLIRAKSNFLDQFRGIVFVGGFSYADAFGSAKGWAGTIKFNPRMAEMFRAFYDRNDTFSLGVCNGCQLMALLGLVPWRGLEEVKQPRFIRNLSERFESGWVNVKIHDSPTIMLQGMAGSVFGIWVAHGEGRFYCPDQQIERTIIEHHLAPIRFVEPCGVATEVYPANPNGSPFGVAALCSPDGRHLAIMPHPERAFLLRQCAWMPREMRQTLKASPWLTMFQNARKWCDQN